MLKLEPPDNHYFSFAVGWLELGNTPEARRELTKLSPTAAQQPDVLELHWALAATERDWSVALQVAEQLVAAEPKRASGWLHRAYALRRVPGGGLSAAWDALLPAVKHFPKEATIPYNLACYACQLGQIDEARAWLGRARSIGNRDKIKSMALADEDLKAFWSEIKLW